SSRCLKNENNRELLRDFKPYSLTQFVKYKFRVP
ncbi:hypothetical protein LEMLEM_LOCUS9029, partial [Lemmus lemmus]